MISWLQQNWGTLTVVCVIAAIAALIVISRVRGRKRGSGGCSCGCGGCAMRDTCHPEKKKTEIESRQNRQKGV